MSKQLVFHHAGVIDGKSLYVETGVETPAVCCVFAGWTKEDGFRVDPHVCNQFCIHEPDFGIQDFSTRGLSLGDFRELVDTLNELRRGIDAGDLQFVQLQRLETGGFIYVEVDPRDGE